MRIMINTRLVVLTLFLLAFGSCGACIAIGARSSEARP